MICTLILLAHLEGFPAFERRERYRDMPMMSGPQVVAGWMEEHEGWVVQSWRCAK